MSVPVASSAALYEMVFLNMKECVKQHTPGRTGISTWVPRSAVLLYSVTRRTRPPELSVTGT